MPNEQVKLIYCQFLSISCRIENTGENDTKVKLNLSKEIKDLRQKINHIDELLKKENLLIDKKIIDKISFLSKSRLLVLEKNYDGLLELIQVLLILY